MNLLPKTEKEILKKGLRTRILIIFSFLISAAFLIGFVTLLPSYFLVTGYFSEVLKDYPKKDDENLVKEILDLPDEINNKLKIFQTNTNRVSVVDSFSKIINHLPAEATLNSFSFSRVQNYDGKNGVIILVSGTAADRDSLVSFSTPLKSSADFSSVDVPVSSLTKDRNLPFSINIFIEN